MLSILTNNNYLYNYYELFEIINTASPKQIIKAYQNKIINYNNTLSSDQINEIKIFKMGFYILMNTELRIIYDNILNNQVIQTTQNVVSTINPEDTDINNLHASLNDQIKEENSLDSLFNIDNTWKDNNDTNVNLGNKKIQIKTNIITNRIFSMAEFNKKPNFPSDFESELRRPLQGRVEKKQI
jgi:DnaJ-class molecular chaperone